MNIFRKRLASKLRDLAYRVDGQTSLVLQPGAGVILTGQGGGGSSGRPIGLNVGGGGTPPTGPAIAVGSSTPSGNCGSSQVIVESPDPPSAEELAKFERRMQLTGSTQTGGSMRNNPAWQAWRAEQGVCEHLDQRRFCHLCNIAPEHVAQTSTGVGFPRPGRWQVKASIANPGYIELMLFLADSGKYVNLLVGPATWTEIKEAGDRQLNIADQLIVKCHPSACDPHVYGRQGPDPDRCEHCAHAVTSVCHIS